MKDTKLALHAVLLLAALSGGCSNDTATSPASTATTSTAGVATFGSFLAANGSSTHTFEVSQAGTISVTLTNVTPAATVGLGIGIPGDVAICGLSSSIETLAGSAPQLTVAVDAGVYCAQIYDAGGITGTGVAFSMTIAHP